MGNRKPTSLKPSLKKHSACASTVEIAYNIESIKEDLEYNEEELDEIIDAAVQLMEYALQRKPIPEFSHDPKKKRLSADKLIRVYNDMQRVRDAEEDEGENMQESETTANKENEFESTLNDEPSA